MRKVLLMALREYKSAVRSKSFLIMVALVPVLMSGGIIATKLLEDRVDTTDKRIAVVDRTGVLADALVKAAEQRNANDLRDPESGRKVKPAYHLSVVPPEVDAAAQRLALSDQVRGRKLHAFLEIGADAIATDSNGDAAVRYYGDNAAIDDVRSWFSQAVNVAIRSNRLAAAGLDEALVQRLTRYTSVEPMSLVSVDARTGVVHEAERSNEGRAIGVPMIMLMLMFMMIMTGATPLVNAVLEEKMQRIAEVLLGSLRPFELMLGKLVGNLGVSLTVLAIYVTAGTIVALQIGFIDDLPFHLLPWMIVYIMAAVMMFGALLMAVGAACNDLKEAQSVMMPAWILVMVPMFVWLPVVKAPLGAFATAMSLIPPFTPMLMLLRQATPAAIPAWQPWVGLAGVVIFTAFVVWTAGRVFRVGILMQGQPPRFSTMFRWALQG